MRPDNLRIERRHDANSAWDSVPISLKRDRFIPVSIYRQCGESSYKHRAWVRQSLKFPVIIIQHLYLSL